MNQSRSVKLSVILPSFNRKALLKRAVCSFLRQDVDQDAELVIVDDGSTDSTSDYLLELANYPSIRSYPFEVNKGVNTARNLGVSLARGEYVLFLDSDDYIYPHSLRKIMQIIAGYVDLKLFCFKVLDESTRMPYILHSPQNGEFIKYDDLLSGNFAGDYAHVVRREVCIKYPFFEDFRAEEFLNWFRIFKEYGPAKYFDFPVIYVRRGGDDSLSHSLTLDSLSKLKEKYKSQMKCIELYMVDYDRLSLKVARALLNKSLLLGLAIGEGRNNKQLFDELKKRSQLNYLFIKFLDNIRAGLAVRFLIIMKGRIKKLWMAVKKA